VQGSIEDVLVHNASWQIALLQQRAMAPAKTSLLLPDCEELK